MGRPSTGKDTRGVFTLHIDSYQSKRMQTADGQPDLSSIAAMLRTTADNLDQHQLTTGILRDADGTSVGRFHLLPGPEGPR